MDFQRRAKGILTQGLVQALFEDAGYRVRGLGIEEILSEMKDASAKLYYSLPKGLRVLPDFLILDDRNNQSWLLEVKYRKIWNSNTVDALESTLTAQGKWWETFLVLVFLGETPRNTPAGDHCRIFRLRYRYRQLEFESAALPGQFLPWKNAAWGHAFPVTGIFPMLRRDSGKALQRCCEFVLAYSLVFDELG